MAASEKAIQSKGSFITQVLKLKGKNKLGEVLSQIFSKSIVVLVGWWYSKNVNEDRIL